ncbi:hypothetical protein LJC44_05845 [Parabacteroides sp. OttesenSCG-928-G06]|nr:hypothetical protein [Parabacteroides sp. OttesenSCG-928-K15]MDL2282609.1 hypothetical protein [Parabacteroides sp. OttesenSCG-928-G06]
MENIGDWLYIILIGVAGIVSIISSGKKKKIEEEAKKKMPPRDIVTPETASDRGFWEMILYPEAENQPKPQPAKTTKNAHKTSQSQAKPARTQTEQPFLAGETEIERAIRLQGNDMRAFDEEIITPLITPEEFQNPETLKKAVLYSEILNRKY